MTKLEPTRTHLNPTATKELRRLLDERGVEWMPSVFDPQHETFYSVENGVGFIVTEFPDIGRMSLACDMRITPEQAIAATLGDGEYERKMDALLCRLTNGKFSKTQAYDLDFMESVVREEFETDAATLGNADLAAENAKLRELVKSMYYDLTHMTFPPDWVTDYEADMRELGIEVDE